MRALWVGSLLICLSVTACQNDDMVGPGQSPAAPVALEVSYYAGVVTVSWELGDGWNEEPFRVYGKRTTDTDYFLIAEVTSCAGGVCYYLDYNVVAGVTYDYYVTAIDPVSGLETASDYSVLVDVPQPTPPPVPGDVSVVGLDDALFVTWDAAARVAEDFSFYRVYLVDDGGADFFLGETDSEGFLDLLAMNGQTSAYYVTSVDTQGHESAASGSASGTPRPDYLAEWIWDYNDRPGSSGFRFQSDEGVTRVIDGDAVDRHFRLEVDGGGWWLVPGPDATVHPDALPTSALRCGPGADADCVDVSAAPTSGYVTLAVGLAAQASYVMRVRGDDGELHYGVIRVEHLGVDADGRDIMIFDWAYQLQANSPSLAIRRGG